MIRVPPPVRAVGAAVLVVGALAGCSMRSASTNAGSDVTGTWTETGSYPTPGGTESVRVTLTIRDGTVQSVQVTGSGDSPTAKQYQAAFASGISAQVVGKPLSTLHVGAVSGSSLTSNGFNSAVDAIRADAA